MLTKNGSCSRRFSRSTVSLRSSRSRRSPCKRLTGNPHISRILETSKGSNKRAGSIRAPKLGQRDRVKHRLDSTIFLDSESEKREIPFALVIFLLQIIPKDPA